MSIIEINSIKDLNIALNQKLNYDVKYVINDVDTFEYLVQLNLENKQIEKKRYIFSTTERFTNNKQVIYNCFKRAWFFETIFKNINLSDCIDEFAKEFNITEVQLDKIKVHGIASVKDWILTSEVKNYIKLNQL